MLLTTALAATIVWKFAEFAVVANALVGDHILCCHKCKKPVMTYVSALVAEMFNRAGQHECAE